MNVETKLRLQFIVASTLGLTLKRKGHARILTYHSVESHPDRIGHISPALFEEHIRYLAEPGYRSYRICDLVQNRTKVVETKPAVILTFDDGLLNSRTAQKNT